MFTEKFGNYVCVGDSISTDINGITFTATIQHDPIQTIDDDDCHNTDQSVTGCDDTQFAKLLECRKAWFDNEWFYCGIVLSASKEGGEIDGNADSLWGIECNYPKSDNDYLTEVANELLKEVIDPVKLKLARLIEKLTA